MMKLKQINEFPTNQINAEWTGDHVQGSFAWSVRVQPSLTGTEARMVLMDGTKNTWNVDDERPWKQKNALV